MATIEVDDELVEEVRRLGFHATRQEAVHEALEEYVQRRRVSAPVGDQLAILELMGQVDYDADYDYKAERRRDSDRVARAFASLDEHGATQ